mgnify:CR=1 FL=1
MSREPFAAASIAGPWSARGAVEYLDSTRIPLRLATLSASGLLIARYLGDTRTDFARWLISRADREVVLRLAPERIVSWDYRARMTSGRASR